MAHSLRRRHLLRRRHSARLPAGPGVTDVSAAATKNKRTAVWRLVAQFAGLGLAAYGADVLLVRFWYAYLAAGLAVVWAAGRFIRPRRRAPLPRPRPPGRAPSAAPAGSDRSGRAS